MNDDDKVMHGFYYYIGSCHVDNSAKDLDRISKLYFETPVPNELNKWFDDYISETRKTQKKKNSWIRFHSISKHVAIFTIVFVLSIFVTTLSVDAFRIKLFNFITEVTEKYTAISVKEMTIDAESNIDWHAYYAPEYIPESYQFIKSESFGDMKIIFYANSSGKEIQFSQTPSNPDYQVDTENAQMTNVLVNGEKGILVVKDSLSTLIWTSDELTFYIIAKLDQKNIMKIAESIKKIKR